MSDNNNASPNESWWVGNFEEGDEWNRRVRQNLQHDANIRIGNDIREEKNTEGDVGRNETANEEGDDANNRAVDNNSEEMDEEGDGEGDEEGDEEEYEEEYEEERPVIRNRFNTEEVRARYVGLTRRYHEVLGDPAYNDELALEYGPHDDDDDDDDDGPYQYFGTDMNVCFFCRDHLPVAEVMSLFEERRDFENWSVPTCDDCFNPENRPCRNCQEVGCICEELAANLE